MNRLPDAGGVKLRHRPRRTRPRQLSADAWRFKHLDEALKPWEDSLSSKERTIILKEQTDWRRAVEIFNWFKRKGCYELNVIHYNVMLRILGEAQKWDLVGSFWNEMQSNRIMPTNSTYGTLINAFCKGGLNKAALVWLSDLYKQGMEPDEVTMGVILQTYKKAGKFQKAEQFFQRAAREGFEDLYTNVGRSPNYGKRVFSRGSIERNRQDGSIPSLKTWCANPYLATPLMCFLFCSNVCCFYGVTEPKHRRPP
ncbi:hypothetical protein C4D60_Mb08t27190 [Musa balbisiana]|uniref:Pentacotripeptide-repeat region of PRORP domain-containing protein n=1 Tax=Musa balbisiana TaxID=52838 RepID=A0A4S8K6Y4_MUSBA|nr:hypothetical protein C4D60_Mb08t27190 [Musa balbisiana]